MRRALVTLVALAALAAPVCAQQPAPSPSAAPVDEVRKQLDDIDAITRQLQQAVEGSTAPGATDLRQDAGTGRARRGTPTPAAAPATPATGAAPAAEHYLPRRAFRRERPRRLPDDEVLFDIDARQSEILELLRRTKSPTRLRALTCELDELEAARWREVQDLRE